MDNPFKSPAILSLCTGMRGLERGIERAIGKLRIIANVEIEAFIIENLVQQMEKGLLAPAPVFTDIKTFPFEKFRGKLHGIIGGYPCQPFSAAGLRKGENDPRHLWPFIKRGIKKSRPQWVFFENVEGHLSLGFERVQKDLRKMGYAIEAGIFTAQEVGAPHRRARLFILGVENYIVQRMRRRNYEQGENRECEIQTEGSSELEHTNNHDGFDVRRQITQSKHSFYCNTSQLANSSSIHAQGCEYRSWQIESWRASNESSNELANTEHNGFNGSKNRESFREGNNSNQKWKESTEQSKGCSNEPAGYNEVVADPNGSRSEQNIQYCQLWSGGIIKPSDFSRKYREAEIEQIDRWPSRPNENQYEWEEARTFPSMGFTVDGYNFREDLLRMFGNAVVEQSAELAFKTLLDKHERK